MNEKIRSLDCSGHLQSAIKHIEAENLTMAMTLLSRYRGCHVRHEDCPCRGEDCGVQDLLVGFFGAEWANQTDAGSDPTEPTDRT